MTRSYQFLDVSSGILLKVIEPFRTTLGARLYQTLKGPHKATIVHRVPIKNGHTRLRKFAFILIDSQQFNNSILLNL